MAIVVLVRYEAQAGRQELARDEITALVRTVTSEEGCLGISVLRKDGEDTSILLHERWTDKDTYFGPHMQTPHIRAFIERAGQFLAGPPEITVWHEV